MSDSVFVATLAGKITAYPMDVRASTVADLIARVSEKEGWSKDSFRLISAGKELTPHATKKLIEVGVDDKSTVNVIFRLLG